MNTTMATIMDIITVMVITMDIITLITLGIVKVLFQTIIPLVIHLLIDMT